MTQALEQQVQHQALDALRHEFALDPDWQLTSKSGEPLTAVDLLTGEELMVEVHVLSMGHALV